MPNDVIIQELEQWLVRNGYKRNDKAFCYRKMMPTSWSVTESLVTDEEIVSNPQNVIKTVENWHKFYQFSCTWWQNPGDTIPNWKFVDEPKKDMTKEEQLKLTQMLCNHVWVSYIGLNEKFDYCRYCDMKREPYVKRF